MTFLFLAITNKLEFTFTFLQLYLAKVYLGLLFSQIIPRKVSLGLKTCDFFFFLAITNKLEFTFTFLQLYLAKVYLGLLFSQIIPSKVYLGLKLKLYLARCISDRN